jgi:hypothetical protein
MRKYNSVRPNHNHPHAHQKRISARQQPIVKLQSVIGNQAVQRLLVQRDEETADERATRYIWDMIRRQDKWITRTFESIEFALQPDERERKLPAIQTIKTMHMATGVLTLEMIEAVRSVVEPVRLGKEQMAKLFQRLRDDVAAKEDMYEGLENPHKWYMKHMDRLIDASRVR